MTNFFDWNRVRGSEEIEHIFKSIKEKGKDASLNDTF